MYHVIATDCAACLQSYKDVLVLMVLCMTGSKTRPPTWLVALGTMKRCLCWAEMEGVGTTRAI